MDTISFYLEKIKNQLTEKGLITALFALLATAFTLSVVSACAGSDCKKVRPSVFPFVYNLLTAVGVYFLCVSTPTTGPLEKLRQGDVLSFSLITAFVCFFILTALYGVALLALSPKKKNKEKSSEEAYTCGASCKRRTGKISEISLPVYSVSTSKLGVTGKTEKINFAALKEIVGQIGSDCPHVIGSRLEKIREKLFSYETANEAFVDDFAEILPAILKLWAKYGNIGDNQ